MKNKLLRAIATVKIFVIFSSLLHAQSIASINILPSSPLNTDTIYVLVNCSFPASPCHLFTKNLSQIDNDFYAEALHCVGFTLPECSYTDTFEILPLTAGNYNFHFGLDAGAVPAPCSAGLNPLDSDLVSFTVSTPTGINNSVDPLRSFSLFPNPSFGSFDITLSEKIKEFGQCNLHINSITGTELKMIAITQQSEHIELNLEPGIYLCYVTAPNYRSAMWKLVMTQLK